MLNIVKVYSNDQMTDMGLNYYWQCSFRYRFSNLSKIELERATKKILSDMGCGHNLTFGVKVNPTSVRVWYDHSNPTAERIARQATDKLLAAVKNQWKENGQFKDYVGTLVV